MEIGLPTDLSRQLEQEVSSGRYVGVDQLIAEAVRYYLDDRLRGERRIESLRRIGRSIDDAGLYERVRLAIQE